MSRTVLGLLICLLLIIAGCGVEWLPNNSAGIGTPDAFAFKAVTCALPGTAVISNEIVVAGLSGTTAISIQNGQYNIADSSGTYVETKWTSSDGFVNNGDKIKVRHTTATVTDPKIMMVVTILKIGVVSATFSSDIGPYMLTSKDTTPACTSTVYAP